MLGRSARVEVCPAISYAEQRESRCCARRGGQEAGGEEGVGKNAEGVQARGGSDGQEKVAAAEARKKAAENVAAEDSKGKVSAASAASASVVSAVEAEVEVKDWSQQKRAR